MKAICEGRKSRQEVVEETLAQYRVVYNRTQQRLEDLRAVSLTALSHFCGRSLMFSSRCESTYSGKEGEGL